MTVVRSGAQHPKGSLPPVHEAWLPAEHPLHRPRHGTRQRLALICAVIFFCTPLTLLAVGVRPANFENRVLAAFPSLSDGWGFLTGLTPWAADHLPLRDRAVDAEDFVSRNIFGEPPAFGQQSRPDRPQGPVQGPLPGPVAPGPSGEEDRERIRQLGFPKVIEGKNNWLYLGYDIVGACLPDRPLDETISALRQLRSVVEASGRKFMLVVAPNKSTMVPEYLPSGYVGAECAREARDAFWRRVTGERGVLDIRPKLRQDAARIGQPVYSSADSHWTFAGALAMTIELAEDIQPGVTASWRATAGEVLKAKGDLPPLIGHTGDYQLATYDLAPDGQNIESRSIDHDFMTPLNLFQARGKGVVNPSVGMIADSYTISALPYLAASFADISLIHSDKAATDPASIGDQFANKQVVVVEAVERSLVGGNNPLLDPSTIKAFGDELARHPLR